MLLKHVSVRDSAGKLYLGVRHSRAVTGRASAAHRKEVRGRHLVLHLPHQNCRRGPLPDYSTCRVHVMYMYMSRLIE